MEIVTLGVGLVLGVALGMRVRSYLVSWRATRVQARLALDRAVEVCGVVLLVALVVAAVAVLAVR